MKRKIVIIKGFSKTKEELTHDRAIIDLYKRYFNSKSGGVYDIDNEIILLEEPSLSELNGYEREINNSDSLIVVLLGHGASIGGKQIFQLQEKLIIHPGQLDFSVPKQLFIIESCRNIYDEIIEVEDLNGLIPKFENGGKIRRPKTEEEAKECYNEELRSIENEITYLFASSIDEPAKNYYFIHYLIKISSVVLI